ncbi:MAG: tRNA-dihydrouridine synthase [Deltaproteobacteria bacterium]|nr:tRNA-dihydrouridine synthase [Deltaproteobacteria bacterium]
MAGVSEPPFRELALELGAGLTPTELISAKSLIRNGHRDPFLARNASREPILATQLFGSDPDEMAAAGEIAAEVGASIVDVNMGCPVPKVTKRCAGSALMRDPARAKAIILALKRTLGKDVAVTAKIRAGWDSRSVNALEVAKTLEDAGLDAIAIHGRTREEGYSGHSRTHLAGTLARALTIPVLANGDLDSAATADAAIRTTGCAGVMIGRAALGNPWIFRELSAAWHAREPPPPPSPAERVELVRRHFRSHLEHVGHVLTGIRRFRSHLAWYARGLAGAPEFIRRAQSLDELSPLLDAMDAFFSTAAWERHERATYDERRALG